jgi:FAD/FMN-containing dehydrogenase
MRGSKERFDFVHEFLVRVFADDLHAKRILSLANGTLGVMTGAALAVSERVNDNETSGMII